ncbi:MAG: FAD-binding oxidoreductase [Spirochaetales bacterium]|nr:FAD-binding oxidoreductase [Spirochaetales bacterium]
MGGMHRVTECRDLGHGAFVLRFERLGMSFVPGQYLLLEVDGEYREYSIYSSMHADFLEILVREVPEGYVTPRLRKLKVGDSLFLDGPIGEFRPYAEAQSVLFLATGTGIAPFHSAVLSYPHLDYTLVHGIRYEDETMESQDFDSHRYIPSVSQPTSGMGEHVTDWLSRHPLGTNGDVFLCGNGAMVVDATAILMDQGVHSLRIQAEAYF